MLSNGRSSGGLKEGKKTCFAFNECYWKSDIHVEEVDNTKKIILIWN